MATVTVMVTCMCETGLPRELHILTIVSQVRVSIRFVHGLYPGFLWIVGGGGGEGQP